MLKEGRLPAIVATSSLELGIDMGAVDLVVQVGSPLTVASGLQRIGRAGHSVGEASRGTIFPTHRGDLVEAAAIAERMLDGAIEETRVPRNPLDILAQQVVAMAALDTWDVDELRRTVVRAYPFSDLGERAFEATLDMLDGRYPSEEFGELRARIVWDRVAGTVRGRAGAQRLAVTSGGTIPDRGLYSVNIFEDGRRVGELDEEMVYELRAGEMFILGATSWRCVDITPQQVLVLPAPGEPGQARVLARRLRGPPLRGRRRGGRAGPRAARRRPSTARCERLRSRAGLDERAARNLVDHLADQAEATGAVPDDRTIVVERFRDQLGDWRVCVLTPFGARVHAPWSLVAAQRLRDLVGSDVQAIHSDDGFALRIADVDRLPGRGRPVPRPRRGCRRGDRPARGQLDVRRRAFARTRRARCCCRGADPASAPRCGSSGSAAPACSRWCRATRRSPSSSRRTASACATSSTSRPWPASCARSAPARCASSRWRPRSRRRWRRRCCSSTSRSTCTTATRRSPSAAPTR